METDNGVQFTSRGFKRILGELVVRHQFTAPGKQDSQNHDRPVCRTGPKDKHCPELLQKVNSSVSDTDTGCFVTQCTEPRMPKALYDKDALGTGAAQTSPSENAAKLQEVFDLRAAQEQTRHYNLKRWERSSQIGDIVWAKEHPKRPKVSRRN